MKKCKLSLICIFPYMDRILSAFSLISTDSGFCPNKGKYECFSVQFLSIETLGEQTNFRSFRIPEKAI